MQGDGERSWADIAGMTGLKKSPSKAGGRQCTTQMGPRDPIAEKLGAPQAEGAWVQGTCLVLQCWDH